ncbi:MAG: hypothetical protein MJZ37_01040 [Bacilli bacterium]|nr:hypothetical protein [Bacilli bacterium]
MAKSGHSLIEPSNKDSERYDKLRSLLRQGSPVTIKDIQDKLNINEKFVTTMINNLSKELPIWEPGRGVYKILEESDFDKYRKCENEQIEVY